MNLTPREIDQLLIFVVADVARRRRERGVKLNYPESVALISEAILEAARDGRSVPECAELGKQVLSHGDVMDGVADLIPRLQVEALFRDGVRLVTVDTPIV
ncbi:MAG TPA: urease subunit gamma [Thermomicrobiales bacterium]|jgi:urease subunit gamma|nr:urease subunit gamma [Thermomicrobiales bacterium]